MFLRNICRKNSRSTWSCLVAVISCDDEQFEILFVFNENKRISIITARLLWVIYIGKSPVAKYTPKIVTKTLV